MHFNVLSLLFVCLLSLTLATNEKHKNSVEASSKLLALLTKKADAPKVSIEASNLPSLLQVAAADCLKLAYEYHDTDEGRMELFVSLFTEVYPAYYWNAVLDYQHLYYIGNYYIRLRTDDGDVVFLFSSNS